MKYLLLPAVTAVTFSLSNFAASAAVLVSWNFETNVSPTIVAASSVASAANASLSVGVSGGFQNNSNGTNVGPAAASGGTWSTMNTGAIAAYALGDSNVVDGVSGFLNSSGYATTPDSTRFISFSLTMDSTIEPAVSALEGIQFNLGNAGSSGPRGVEVTYRIGGIGSFTSLGGTNVPNNTASNFGLFTFNLGSPITLNGDDVVEFRLLGFANAGGNSVRLDNVRITAIPEPSTFMMVGIAGIVGLVAAGRRRRIMNA